MKKIILILAFMIFGCKDDPVATYEGPALPIVAFQGPTTTSTDTAAGNVLGWISEFNNFSLYSFYRFTTKKATQAGDTYTWSAVEEGVTYVLTGIIRPDSGFNWKFVLSGTKDGITYNNWMAFEGSTDATQHNASWQIYNDNTTTKGADFLWTISSNGSLIGTLNVYTDGALSGTTVITDNANKTGEIRIFQGSVQIYRAIWISNGSGQYWYYDESGNITSQGSWS